MGFDLLALSPLKVGRRSRDGEARFGKQAPFFRCCFWARGRDVEGAGGDNLSRIKGQEQKTLSTFVCCALYVQYDLCFMSGLEVVSINFVSMGKNAVYWARMGKCEVPLGCGKSVSLPSNFVNLHISWNASHLEMDYAEEAQEFCGRKKKMLR